MSLFLLHRTRSSRVVLLALLALPPASTLQSADTVTDIEQVRANLAAALALRDQAAKETAAWRIQEPEVDGLIALARGEEQALSGAIEASRAVLDALEKETAADAARTEARKQLVQRAGVRIEALIGALTRQRSLWPEALVSRTEGTMLKITQAKFPRDLAAMRNDLDLASGMIEEAMDFQSKVSETIVVRAQADGRQAVYSVIHFGLGAAYFHSGELGEAGTIRFDGATWIWTRDDSLLAPLAQFSAILKGTPAEFVRLPVALRLKPAAGEVQP